MSDQKVSDQVISIDVDDANLSLESVMASVKLLQDRVAGMEKQFVAEVGTSRSSLTPVEILCKEKKVPTLSQPKVINPKKVVGQPLKSSGGSWVKVSNR
ncbi:MAG: hypothetical protein ACK5XN_30695 [Bacteroidota bacterium]